MDDDMPDQESAASATRVNDWMLCVDKLPERPLTVVEDKYTRLFILDVNGVPGHDQYMFVAPNGVCVLGLAPSHPLIAAHRADGQAAQPAAAQQEPGAAAAPAAAVVDPPPASSSARETEDASTSAPQQSAADLAPAAAAEPCTAAPSNRGGGGGSGGGGSGGGGGAAGPCSLDDVLRVTLGRGHQEGLKQSGKKQNAGPQVQPATVLCTLESKAGARFDIRAGVSGKLLELNARLVKEVQLLYNRPCREGYIAAVFPAEAQLKQLLQSLVPVQQYLDLRGMTPEDLL